MVMSASRWALRPHPRAAGFPWNRWQLSPGIGGSFAMESVATFVWNRWQLCRGISGRIATESVATLAWNTHDFQHRGNLGTLRGEVRGNAE
jgi:hypothetical protein